MLREYQEALTQTQGQIEAQAAEQESGLQAEAEKQKAEVQRQSDEAKAMVRGEISEVEEQHQAIAQQLRQAERKEQFKGIMPTYKPAVLETEKKVRELETAAGELIGEGRLGFEDIEKQKVDIFAEIDKALGDALGQVKAEKERVIADVARQYEEASVEFERQQSQARQIFSGGGGGGGGGGGEAPSEGEGEGGEPEGEYTPPSDEERQQASDREAELKDAIDFSKDVEQNPSLLGEDEDTRAYWESVADIQTKYDLIQQKNEVEKSYEEAGVPLSGAARRYVEQIKAITLSPSSPFITLTPEGRMEINTKLTTIEKIGFSLDDFAKMGFNPEQLQNIKAQEIEYERQRQEWLRTPTPIPTLEPIKPLTGDEALRKLKDENKIPQDAILISSVIDPTTGDVRVSYQSPSKTMLIVDVGGVKKEIPKGEWDSKTDVKRLEFMLGRTPSLQEYIDYNVATKLTGLSAAQKLHPGYAQKAMEDWRKEYPNISMAKAQISSAFEALGLPSLKATFYPDITFKDITLTEHLTTVLTGGTAALVGMGFAGVLGRGVSGAILTYGVAPTLGGIKIYLEAPHWDEMSTSDKALAVVTDALFFLPAMVGVGKGMADIPKSAKVSLAYDKANTTAKVANDNIAKLNKVSLKDPSYAGIRDATYEAVANAKAANNELIKVLQANPTSKMAQYVNSKIIVDSATNAKLAHENMLVALDRISGDAKAGLITDAEAASFAKQATQASRLADEAFVDKLSMLDRVDLTKLKQIEEVSGYKGLVDNVKEVNRAQKAITEAWDKIKTIEENPQNWDSEAMLKARNELQVARDNLDKALIKFEGITQSRVAVSPSTGYDEIIMRKAGEIDRLNKAISQVEINKRLAFLESKVKEFHEEWLGLRGELAKAQGELEQLVASRNAGLPLQAEQTGFIIKVNPVKPDVQKLLDEINNWNKTHLRPSPESLAGGKARTLTALRPVEVVAKPTFKIEPLFKITETIPKAKPTAPKIAPKAAPSVFPGITTKTRTTTETTYQPRGGEERLGAMTPEQAQRLRGDTQRVERVVGRPIPESIDVSGLSIPEIIKKVTEETIKERQGKPFNEFNPIVQAQVLDITKAAIERINQLRDKGMTDTQIQIQIREMIDTSTNLITDTTTKTQLKNLTATMNQVALRAARAIKTGLLTRLKTPVIKTGWQIFKIPPIPFGKAKKWVKGKPIPPATVVWKMGEPRGHPEGMWNLLPYPYDQLYYDDEIPEGATKIASGKGSAKATLQMIGGAPPEDISKTKDIGATLLNIRVQDGVAELNFSQDPIDAYKGKQERQTVGAFADDEEELEQEYEELPEEEEEERQEERRIIQEKALEAEEKRREAYSVGELTDLPEFAFLKEEEEIPQAEAGEPEAGLQSSMIEEVPLKKVRPKGKGKLVQADMADYLKLQQVEAGEPVELTLEEKEVAPPLEGQITFKGEVIGEEEPEPTPIPTLEQKIEALSEGEIEKMVAEAEPEPVSPLEISEEILGIEPEPQKVVFQLQEREVEGKRQVLDPETMEWVEVPKAEPIPEEVVVVKPPKEVVGKSAIASDTETGKRYQFKYKVVDLNDLIPSQTDVFTDNPLFLSELQPRDRTRVASRVQIEGYAANLKPELLLYESPTLESGAPIVGKDMMVESGNARILALRKAQQEHPEQYEKYREALKAEIGKFGSDVGDIEFIGTPVLVRVRETELTPEERLEFVSEANISPVLAMSPYEQARQDAKRLSAEVLSGLKVGEAESIDQALRLRGNADFVNYFMSKIPQNERAQLADQEGNVNLQGINRVKQAILAKTYGGDAGQVLTQVFIESPDPEIKNIQLAMYQSLPEMAKTKVMVESGQVDEKYEVADDLAAAVAKYASLKEKGKKITFYLKERGLWGEELNPRQKAILAHLDDIGKSSKKTREFIGYLTEGISNLPLKGQIGFEMPAVEGEEITKEYVIRNAINRQRRENEQEPIAPITVTPTKTPIPRVVEPRPSVEGAIGVGREVGEDVGVERQDAGRATTEPTGFEIPEVVAQPVSEPIDILTYIPTSGKKHIDEITRESGLPVSKVTADLTMLQLEGKVIDEGGGNYRLPYKFAPPEPIPTPSYEPEVEEALEAISKPKEPEIPIPTSEEIAEAVRAKKEKMGLGEKPPAPQREPKPIYISPEEYRKLSDGRKGARATKEEVKLMVAANPDVLRDNPELAGILAEAESIVKAKGEKKAIRVEGEPAVVGFALEEELEPEFIFVELPPERRVARAEAPREKRPTPTPIPIAEEREAEAPRPAGLGKAELSQYKSGYLKVYIVNGGFLRSRYKVPYEAGGSDVTMPDIIPLNEVWVDRDLSKAEWMREVLAQLRIRRLVREKGLPIGEADEVVRKEVADYGDMTGMIDNAIKDEIMFHPEKSIDGKATRRLTKYGTVDRRQRLNGNGKRQRHPTKDWWEGEEYQPEPEPRPKPLSIPVGRTYFGHKILDIPATTGRELD